jgi:acetyl esterase
MTTPNPTTPRPITPRAATQGAATQGGATPIPPTPSPESQRVLARLAEAAAAAGPPPANAHDVAKAWRARAAASAASRPKGPDLFEVTDLSCAEAGRSVGLRLYRPAPGVLPVMIYLHGGGFTCGSIADYDPAARHLAQETGWAVVAVAFRLSPEHPYPAGLDDCDLALRHIAGAAGGLGLDPARLVLIGDSSGGQFAVAVALRARERGGPSLAGIVCLYPILDLRADAQYASRAANDGRIVDLRQTEQLMTLYLGDTDRTLPTVSPVLATLAGLPPTLVVACGCDPLFDEGVLLGDRLREAGVRVAVARLAGALHGVLSLSAMLPEATHALLAAVREFLGTLR